MRAALLATALTVIPVGFAQAQDCRAAIERVEQALSASADLAADDGPAKQEGDTAEKQPQEGNPRDDVDAGTSSPSGQEGQVYTEHPQLGDPTKTPGDGSSGDENQSEAASRDREQQGPSRQEGDAAETQPQHGEPERVTSEEALDRDESELSEQTSGESSNAPLRVREGRIADLRDLRDEAARQMAAGNHGRCLDLMNKADDLMEAEADR
ncbi:hypothetical protein [Chelativorans sp. YIM 93263]|uniref:hypothetical protein n=1 Tax=Chelativorans sp. YIM 93263 TaxID=2906648 RepID=UPI002378DC80|nr:hypothetical protein [Chelativorans sp. YIM 93263]